MEFGSNSQLPKVNWRLDVFNAAANKLTMMAAKTSPTPGCSSCQARTQSRITNAMTRPPVKIGEITFATALSESMPENRRPMSFLNWPQDASNKYAQGGESGPNQVYLESHERAHADHFDENET